MAEVRGEGSIVQLEKGKPRGKCRKWQLRVPVGLDPRTGKYRTRTRRVSGTYTEAKKALREFIDEVESDHVQGRTDWTFEAYAKHYLEMREAMGDMTPCSGKTRLTEARAIDRHIGKAKLDRVTTSMLDEAYVAMMRGDTATGKPASGTYVRRINDLVRLVFGAAKKEGLVTENPCDGVTLPRMNEPRRKALEPKRAHEFVESLDPTDPHELACLLAATLGLRCGEACGLSWGDVDWDRHVVRIIHSYDPLRHLKSPKTRAGIRMLPLPDVTYDGLRAARAAWRGGAGLARHEPNEDDPVVVNRWGGRMNPNKLAAWWRRNRDGYGLGDITLHELRHTYLTLLAESGVHPKVMQELAGHSSSNITMDIYTHVNMDDKREAVRRVSAIF
ncbi:MAG: site-specific integrase [Olsenella sp.]|jgi:integrase|nr:site-specific integrase [Olsenella sp.]